MGEEEGDFFFGTVMSFKSSSKICTYFSQGCKTHTLKKIGKKEKQNNSVGIINGI